MIARSAQVSAVCSRCRLQLLRQLTPVRYVTTDANGVPIPIIGATEDASQDTSQDTNQDQRPEPRRTPDVANQRKFWESEGQRPESKGSPDVANQQKPWKYPHTRILRLDIQHRSGDRLLQEAVTDLGSDMLGKPGRVIVMKDGGRIRRNKPSSAADQKGDEPSPAADNGQKSNSPTNEATFIEQLVNSQRAAPNPHEASSNIDELKPEGKLLLEKDFRKLQATLSKGFLVKQLSSYIQHDEAQKRQLRRGVLIKRELERKEPLGVGLGMRKESQKKILLKEAMSKEDAELNYEWLLKRTPWVPLHTQGNLAENLDPALQGYVSATATKKEILATVLMRKCWGLSISELELQLGETEIQVRDAEFILLMHGTQRFLNTLGETWLDRSETIEVLRDQSKIRLITPKPKADLILKDLDGILQKIVQHTIPVVLFSSEVPDPAVLKELGRITNTRIIPSHTGKKLHVQWIEVQSPADDEHTELEHLGHVVFRLLLTTGAHEATSSLLSPTAPEGEPGRLVEDATSKDKLTWKDRLAKWARYVYPVRQETAGITSPALPIKEFKLPFKPLETTDIPDSALSAMSTRYPIRWPNILRTSTVAHFGQILHPYHPPNSNPSLPELLRSTDRRLFNPTTPHPLHLSNLELSDGNAIPPLIRTKLTLVIRFWPSPSTKPSRGRQPREAPGAADAPAAPALELRLAVSDNEVKGVEGLRAIIGTHHTDVMLPSSPVDVRFTQTRYEDLEAPDRETLAAFQPIVDLLQRARIDLKDGRVDLPPSQRFPIPRRLLPATRDPAARDHDAGNGVQGASGKAGKAANDGPPHAPHPDDGGSVSYEFVGLEFQRSASLPYHGHQLTYTSIEAGVGGGRRAEVTLTPLQPLSEPAGAPSTTATPDTGRLQEDFLACCSRFIANHSLWTGLKDRRDEN
ncbi:hypothetical protein F4802DRAFT_590418 [Xylaria palmicola]|nr:hypothetical protein F4802DRAFT_590418 [Xylaria palmicola]